MQANRNAPTLAQLPAHDRKAIQAGLDTLRAEGVSASFPDGLGRIVWRLLQEAADTLSRLPDRERAFLTAGDRIAWPSVIHTAQEQYEADLQRLIDLKETPSLVPLPRLPISDPSAEPRMYVVLSWLRFHTVRGGNINRLRLEKRAILALAAGARPRSVRHLLRARSRSAPDMLRQRVVQKICAGLLAGLH